MCCWRGGLQRHDRQAGLQAYRCDSEVAFSFYFYNQPRIDRATHSISRVVWGYIVKKYGWGKRPAPRPCAMTGGRAAVRPLLLFLLLLLNSSCVGASPWAQGLLLWPCLLMLLAGMCSQGCCCCSAEMLFRPTTAWWLASRKRSKSRMLSTGRLASTKLSSASASTASTIRLALRHSAVD